MMSSVISTEHWNASFDVKDDERSKTLSVDVTLWDKVGHDYKEKKFPPEYFSRALDVYIKLQAAISAFEAGDSNVSPIDVWTEAVEAEEHEQGCAQMARRALLTLNAEMPPNSELSRIITEAVNRIEKLL